MKKEKEYQNHLEILGDRNSYYKTDKEAVFMRYKKDYMRNGQLIPAYNIQIAVNSNYILDFKIFLDIILKMLLLMQVMKVMKT